MARVPGHDDAVGGDGEVEAPLLRHAGEHPGRLPDDGGEIDRVAGCDGLRVGRLGERQQGVGQPGQVPRLLEHLFQRFAILLRPAVVRDRDFHEAAHGGQRAAQLVGRVGHEPLLAIDVIGHLVEETVDRPREPVQLVAAPLHRQPFAELAGPEILGYLQDGGHRPGRPPGEPPARQRREQRDDGADDQQFPHQAGEAVVEAGGVGADPHVIRG